MYNIHFNRRIAIVAVFSFGGVVLSYLMLKPKTPFVHSMGQITLAKVLHLSNEVQKKSRGDLIWQVLLQGDQLAQGDFVRTSMDSAVEIQFIQGHSKLRLGPETTVVIERLKDEKLELNMIRGDLMIQATDIKNMVSVKTKEAEISLNNATAGVSLDKSGKLALEVFSGEVKARNESGENIVKQNENALISGLGIVKNENFFQMLAPKVSETIFLNGRNPFMELSWVEHKNKFQYQLFIGRNVDLLAPVI